MSGIREGLGDWAAGHGDEVAVRVASHEKATRAAIATRRRRRALGGGVGATLAIVAVAATVVAVNGSTVPAATNPVVPIGQLACNQPWALEEGESIHDPEQADRVNAPGGDWLKFTDGGEVIENPDSVWVGYEDIHWQGTLAHDDSLAVRAEIVAVQDGVVVGAGQDEAAGGYSLDGDALEVSAPLPGVCGQVNAGAADGDYTYHLVVTVSEATTGAPIMSFVDPGGSITLEFSGLADWFGSDTGSPAHLSAPRGDTYQAFLVQEPPPGSCTPYSDLMAEDVPSSTTPTYEVTIPGVQALTGEIWGKAPAVVIDDEGFKDWYVGLPTGITAQEVDGGNPLGKLEWTTGTTWGESEAPGDLRLINTANAAYPTEFGADCVVTEPIPALRGAVFLIIDGVDWEALGDSNPLLDLATTEGYQTWVYLGQAGSVGP